MNERYADSFSAFLDPPERKRADSSSLVERQILRIASDGNIHSVSDLEKKLHLDLLEISPILERLSRVNLIRIESGNGVTITNAGRETLYPQEG